MKPIRSIGVVGAGTMGLGIAQVCGTHGFDVILFDVNPDQVRRALGTIEASLLIQIGKGKLSIESKEGIMSRIKPATDLSEMHADLIIEAAVERLEVKQELFAKLEQINDGHAILASNTSSISISQIARDLHDPSSCVGLHFFNPAERMRLVEIISGDATRPTIREALRSFALVIGKTPVMAKDSPGFIVNRVARHYYVESLKLLEENVSDVQTVDALLRSAGFKMGPFELMDLIGVDTNLSVTTSIYDSFGRAHKFAPSQIQQKLVMNGHFGRKTGRGFYEYEKKRI